jgi:hypothetical protein
MKYTICLTINKTIDIEDVDKDSPQIIKEIESEGWIIDDLFIEKE